MAGTICHIRTGPLCQSGSTLVAVVTDYVALTWTERIGGNRGDCTLIVRADDPWVSKIGILNVIRIVDINSDNTTSVYEYRITDLVDGPHLGTVQVTGMDLSQDTGRVTANTIVGGVTTTQLGSVTLTPDQFVSQFVVPALVAVGNTWIVKGTITPTNAVTLAISQMTPGGIMSALETATKYEWWLSRNGDTNYQINLGRMTTAGNPLAHVGSNVETLDRQVIVDQRFYTRAWPLGAVVGTETEPTGIGQNGWTVSSAPDSTHLVLAHPQAGQLGPIGQDHHLQNLYLLSTRLATPPMFFQEAGAPPNGAYAYGSPAYDSTRSTLWWAAALPTQGLNWYRITDGARGWVPFDSTVTGGTGVNASCSGGQIVYSAARDRVYVLSYNGTNQYLTRINAGTKAVEATLAMLGSAGQPGYLCDATANDQVIVGYPKNTVHAGVVVGLTAFAVAGSLPLSGTGTDARLFTWDSGTGKYIGYGNGTQQVQHWSAAYAYVGTVAAPVGLAGTISTVYNDGAGVIHCFDSAGSACAFTVSTLTFGTVYAMDATPYARATWSSIGYSQPTVTRVNGKLFFTGGDHSATQGQFQTLRAVDPASSYHDVANSYAVVEGQQVIYDATYDLWIVVSANAYVTLYYAAGNGLSASPFRRWQVTDSVFSTQTVSMLARTGLPVIAGDMVEVRADVNDSLQQSMIDPNAVSVYGIIDGFPKFTDPYKRNYHLNPQGAKRASSNTMSDGFGWSSVAHPQAMAAAKNWTGAVIQSLKSGAVSGTANRTMTGAVKTTTAALASGGDVTVALTIKSLPIGRVVNAGDVVNWTGALSATIPDTLVVTGGTVNGSGEVTVTVSTVNRTAAWTVTLNDPVTIYQPCKDDYLGDALIPLPFCRSNAQPGNWPGWMTGVALPYIAGAASGWVITRYKVLHGANAAIDMSTFAAGYGPMVTFGHGNAVTLALTGTLSNGGAWAIEDLVMAQQFTLLSTADRFLNVGMRSPTPATVTTPALALWLSSVEVYLSNSTSVPGATGTLFGKVPGDELIPWIGTENLLFTQARSMPTTNYKLQVIDQGNSIPFKLGMSPRVLDPARGVNTITPRIVEITRAATRGGNISRRPVMTLGNRDALIADAVVHLSVGAG